MAQSTICLALLAMIASATAAPSGWPVVTYAQSYSAHAVDHSVAQSVYPAVRAAPVVPTAAIAEPLIAAPARIAAPAAAPLIPAPAPLAAAPLAAASAPLVASPAAPYFASPYFASPYAAPYLSW